MPSSSDKDPDSSTSEEGALSSTENSDENESDSDGEGFKRFFHSMIFGTPTNTSEPVPSTSSAPDPILPESNYTGLRLVEKSKEDDSYPSGSDEESREKRRKHPRNSCTPADLRRCLQRFKSSPNYKRLKAKQFATADEYFHLKLENHHGEFDVYPPEDNSGRVVEVPGEKFANIFMNVPDIDLNLDYNEIEEEQAIQNARMAARSITPRGRPSQNVKKKNLTKFSHESKQANQGARLATRSRRHRCRPPHNVKKLQTFTKGKINSAYACISSPKRDSSSSDSDVEQRKHIDVSDKSLSLKKASGSSRSNTKRRKPASIFDKSSALSKTGSGSYSNVKLKECYVVLDRYSPPPETVSSSSHSSGMQRMHIFKKPSSLLKKGSSLFHKDVQKEESVLNKSSSSPKKDSAPLDTEETGIIDPDKCSSKKDSEGEYPLDVQKKKQHAPIPSRKRVTRRKKSKILPTTVPESKSKSRNGSSHFSAEKKLPAGDTSDMGESDEKPVPCPSQKSVGRKKKSVRSSYFFGKKGKSHLLAEQEKQPNTSVCSKSGRKKNGSSNASDSFK